MSRRKSKQPIQLRKKKLSNGDESLYLDYYVSGQRKYEYLKLYINNHPKTNEDKNKNKKTLEIAERILQERLKNFTSIEYCENDTYISDFIKSELGGKYKPLIPILGDAKILDFNKKSFYYSIIEKLKTMKLREGTKHIYYIYIKTIAHKANEKEKINITIKIPSCPFKPSESRRNFLTIEEVRKVASIQSLNTEILDMRDAFMFSCLTGLRYSDVKSLKWEEVEEINGRTRLNFKQRKTKTCEYYDISQQAVKFMGERKSKNEYVFKIHKINKTYISHIIKEIMSIAGIEKKITYHCSRHTFAVMMLDLGVDLFTTSKLLGHKDIKTTQIYAKVLDKNKQKAVDLIPEI